MASRVCIIKILMMSLFFAQCSVVFSVPTQELDAMLSIVRGRGYNLFSNAIATSDLQIDLLMASPNASFTFFAPTDSSLFALAMTQSASAYTATLRYHVLPRRLSASDLGRLPSQLAVPTLLRAQYVFLTRHPRDSSLSGAVSVNGVNVVLPGLYYGRHIAVHGLEGILNLQAQIGMAYGSPPLPSIRPSAPRSFPPQIDRDSKENKAFTVRPADHAIGLSSVDPPISPGISANATVDLPFNRVFLGPAPQRSRFQAESPDDSTEQKSVPPPENSSVSPSASPGLPPAVASHLTPSMYPRQNVDAESPTALISSAEAGETASMMELEDGLSGRTVEEYEPLDWMTFGFTDGKSNDVNIEDSHPRPNVVQRL